MVVLDIAEKERLKARPLFVLVSFQWLFLRTFISRDLFSIAGKLWGCALVSNLRWSSLQRSLNKMNRYPLLFFWPNCLYVCMLWQLNEKRSRCRQPSWIQTWAGHCAIVPWSNSWPLFCGVTAQWPIQAWQNFRVYFKWEHHDMLFTYFLKPRVPYEETCWMAKLKQKNPTVYHWVVDQCLKWVAEKQKNTRVATLFLE